jgi:citrate synthase
MTTYRTRTGRFDWRLEALRWPVTSEVGPGLEGVVAATTRVSWIDPDGGLPIYRGVPVDRLAGRVGFEEVAHLLITGHHATDDPVAFVAFRDALRSGARLPGAVPSLLAEQDPATHPTRLLRACVSALGCHEIGADDDITGARHWRELRIVGQVAALVAAVTRHVRGAPATASRTDLSPAAWILQALGHPDPCPADVEALNAVLVLYAVHGLDSPTLTSVVVASCLADPYTNVVAGLSALRGPRQGGATETVLGQLLPLDGAASARRWAEAALSRGERIAGFGHRLYRTADPRVALLRRVAADVGRRHGDETLVEVARAVEATAAARLAPRGVHVNLNLWAAVALSLLGAPPPLVPCIVAAARVAGMVALVREALDDIRLYRPLSRSVRAAVEES